MGFDLFSITVAYFGRLEYNELTHLTVMRSTNTSTPTEADEGKENTETKMPDTYQVLEGGGSGGEGGPVQKRDFVALHLGIQIYEMEQGVYLVDFKCSGYETADGKLLEEKEVMSPFPFLDMAARLIMQLAEAD